MDATPSVALPPDAESGVPSRPPQALEIGGRLFEWGRRTYVMGIINVTPDSFSGDGLMTSGADPVAAAVARARQMAEDGADILDIGGQSTRPGHAALRVDEELARVIPVMKEVHDALPDMPLSIDTTSAEVAEAALEVGARLFNDVWGTAAEPALLKLAAGLGMPIVLMHNRVEARYRNVVAEVIADLQRAIETALSAGIAWERLIVDPGIGFGKTAEHNLAVLHDLAAFQVLGRPILLGTSRKSTIGKVLDLPADQRLEGTLATTALAVTASVDIVRVHDVLPNVRTARMSDAVIRPGWGHP
ncbi:MAG TPA: dihydropteroate synthase [Candidatus Limnocylindria bacterium]|nr:dihydropteroate synthase [Candidatus Limnocylindria bacterium]